MRRPAWFRAAFSSRHRWAARARSTSTGDVVLFALQVNYFDAFVFDRADVHRFVDFLLLGVKRRIPNLLDLLRHWIYDLQRVVVAQKQLIAALRSQLNDFKVDWLLGLKSARLLERAVDEVEIVIALHTNNQFVFFVLNAFLDRFVSQVTLVQNVELKLLLE